MKETFAGEAVYKSMISTLDFLGLPDQSVRIAGVKVVSDMSLMNPSELRQMAVDDRIRGVLHSESSSKGKGKGKGKGKTNNVQSPKTCTAFAKTTANHYHKSRLKA